MHPSVWKTDLDAWALCRKLATGLLLGGWLGLGDEGEQLI